VNKKKIKKRFSILGILKTLTWPKNIRRFVSEPNFFIMKTDMKSA